jgi:hypothetical protein
MKKSDGRRRESASKRLPPVSIPLPFEKAVEGLLAVDPKQPVESKRVKKKTRTEK